MSGELELTVVREADDDAGFLAAFAETDQMVVAVGGDSSSRPAVLASSNARTFELRTTPRKLGLRDALVVGDAIWVCGEYGQLASTRDHGATWQLFSTQTDQCLFSLALAADGAVWCVGDQGIALRVRGPQPQRVDLGTDVRFAKVYAVRDEIVVLGQDGKLRRWRDGSVTAVSTGSTTPLTALAVTKSAWVVIGDGGFIARSPDGQWYSRVRSDSEVDFEGITLLRDGRLVLVGDRGTVLTSSDEGRSWRTFATNLPLAHLWSIQRFGAGALIGGDDGLVLRLAPPDDPHWADRPGNRAVDVAGEIMVKDAPPLALPGDPSGVVNLLDGVFRSGPSGFIARGLAAYLAAVTGTIDAAQDEDEDDDDEDDDEAQQEVERDLRGIPVDNEAFAALEVAGDAASFTRNYGVAMPADAAAFFHLVRNVTSATTFHELVLDSELRPDVGELNLFELMVRRNQQAYTGTDLVEAFCGVFSIGSLRSGDTYLMEIYEWEREGSARQVLHFDHETGAFSRVVADSLDSFVFRAALIRAHRAGIISATTFDVATQALRGKVDPTYDAERRDSEFFFFRARWIIALLKNDGVTDLDAIKELFAPDFNQRVPPEQLAARFEACEKYIPTALYAMWRAYFFEEPELARYLEIGGKHSARLVQDCARLIAELLAGRNTLGTITDVGAWLAGFRALDVDPRRAAARAEEAKVKQVAIEAREAAVEAELEGALRSDWTTLGWAWLADGIAHRRLLARLAEGADAVAISSLDKLRDLNERDREAAIQTIARELSPELETILVGSLVRDDRLVDVLVREEEDNARVDATGSEAPPPDPGRVIAATKLSERALRLAPSDADVQFTHAMLLLDADDVGLEGRVEDLLMRLPLFAATTRVNVAVRMGNRAHDRFAAAVDCVLAHPVAGVQSELMSELGKAILTHTPARAIQFAPLVPAELDLLADLAHVAITRRNPETAMVFYDRVLSLPIPETGVERENYLRALNNACIAAHSAKAFATAVKIADHAQPYAEENPYIYHSAACAYASVGDFARALEQVRRAIAADYVHVEKVELDSDLGALLDWPEFKALFRDWHAQKEGN